ncbi:hypothetical protein C3B51_18670 [Pseudoalteromonas rubra]|uniref:Uncharacterized protein n=1 Tax=Pseudoalteromonas rubra TaxID=43658 RepID=A0A4Q7E0B4_9GAMM|nr:hypothetical protein [Pseudoalteromonas rubra]RZM75327.1 hypothetical protein C3B51_18670 [Pseudoalteromonas rubra]
MRKVIYFIILCLSFTGYSNEIDILGTLSSYVHVKCDGDRVDALLTLENKTPYVITVLPEQGFTTSKVDPSIFSVYDAEAYRSALLGGNNRKTALLIGNFNGNLSGKNVKFEAFEKKYWIYKDLGKHYNLVSGRDYFLKVAFMGVNVKYEDGTKEFTVLKSGAFLFPNCKREK